MTSLVRKKNPDICVSQSTVGWVKAFKCSFNDILCVFSCSWMFFDQKDYQGKSFTLRPTEDARRITEQLEKDSFISVQSITRLV